MRAFVLVCLVGGCDGLPGHSLADAHHISAVGVGASDVYWLEFDGSLHRVKKSGGAAVQLATGLDNNFSQILEVGDSLFLSGSYDAVVRVDLSTGEATSVVSTAYWLGAVGTDVYWADSRGLNKLTNGGPDPSPLPLTSMSPTLSAGALDSGHFYWASSYENPPGIWRIALNGGAPEAVVSDLDISSVSLAVDASNVYWFSGGSERLMKAPLDSSTAPTTLASQINFGHSLAIDGQSCYWEESQRNGEERIRSVPLSGGGTTTILSTKSTLVDLFSDANRLYFGAWGEWTSTTDHTDDGSSFSAWVLSEAPGEIAFIDR